MEKNKTKIRFATQSYKGKKVSAIAEFENNKMVSFAAEKGTVRNIETINLPDHYFKQYAERFGAGKDFDLL